MTAGESASTLTPARDVLASYRTALAAVGELQEWRLDAFDRVEIPVATAGLVPFDDPARAANGVGYGTTGDAAAIGALGELAEQVIMGAAVRDLPLTHGSYRELVTAHGADLVVDPLTLTLPAGSPYTPDQPLVWVPATRWRTGAEVLVPIEFVASSTAGLPAGYQPLVVPISNGLGAGDSIERAVGHALLELVQRDGDTVSFRALDQGQVIDLGGLTDPGARATLQLLRDAGIDPIVKLASTDFACVVYAAADDVHPDSPALAVSAMGEAAHPDAQIAIGKALLEYASSRARRAFAFGPATRVAALLPEYWAQESTFTIGEQEPRALQSMREWSASSPVALRDLVAPALFRSTGRVEIGDLPAPDPTGFASPSVLLATMLERLSDFDVLVVSGRLGDISTAKVIAPGLEVETLSYLRIGERILRRLLDRDSPLVGLGLPDTATRLPLRLTAAAEARIGGPAWCDRDAVDDLVGPLYPLYREPRRHAVQRTADTS